MSATIASYGIPSVQRESTKGPFVSWELAKIQAPHGEFPLSGTTGVGGNAPSAVFNLQRSRRQRSIGYVMRCLSPQSNPTRAVMIAVDEDSGEVMYSLKAKVIAYGTDGKELNLTFRATKHSSKVLSMAVRNFAEAIIDSAASGVYSYLSEQGWRRASTGQDAEVAAQEAASEASDEVVPF